MWIVFPYSGSSRVQRGQTYSSRFEWRLHLLVLQFLPVHVAEEAVVPDVSLPLRTTAQSFRWMLRHQLDRGEKSITVCPSFLSSLNRTFPVSWHMCFVPFQIHTFSCLFLQCWLPSPSVSNSFNWPSSFHCLLLFLMTSIFPSLSPSSIMIWKLIFIYLPILPAVPILFTMTGWWWYMKSSPKFTIKANHPEGDKVCN